MGLGIVQRKHFAQCLAPKTLVHVLRRVSILHIMRAICTKAATAHTCLTCSLLNLHGVARRDVICIQEFVVYALSEVLKNAVQAMVDVHGAWDLDEAEPIVVTVRCGHELGQLPESGGFGAELAGTPVQCGPTEPGESLDTRDERFGWRQWHPPARHKTLKRPEHGVLSRKDHTAGGLSSSCAQPRANGDQGARSRWWTVEVRDSGRGLQAAELINMQKFFRTTVPQRESTYGYSKAHGSQYAGLGVGMPMTALYVNFMGGSIHWQSVGTPGAGVVATVTLPMDGFDFQASGAVL